MFGRNNSEADTTEVFTVRDGFSVADGVGGMTHYPPGTPVRGDSTLAQTHRALLQPAFPQGVPVSAAVEQATAQPGERRVLQTPGGRTVGAGPAHHTGHAHGEQATTTPGGDMPHRDLIPPEHPDSPASPFAPAQPAAGVVAPDVPAEQNLAGGPVAGTDEANDVDAQAFADAASDPAQGAAPVPAGKVVPDSRSGDEPLRGAALDEALEAAELPKSGTVAEKQARLAEYQATSGS